MLLTKTATRYELQGVPQLESSVPRDAGFKYDPVRRVWFTKTRWQAVKLAQFAADPLKSILEEIANRKPKAQSLGGGMADRDILTELRGLMREYLERLHRERHDLPESHVFYEPRPDQPE